MKPIEPVAYTMAEAGRRLGVHPATVARWLNEGLLTTSTQVAGSGRYVTAASVRDVLGRRRAKR